MHKKKVKGRCEILRGTKREKAYQPDGIRTQDERKWGFRPNPSPN